MLAPQRLGRYMLPDGKIYTEYFYIKSAEGLPFSPLDPELDPENKRNRKREVEWFHVPEYNTLVRVCNEIVDAVNAIY